MKHLQKKERKKEKKAGKVQNFLNPLPLDCVNVVHCFLRGICYTGQIITLQECLSSPAKGGSRSASVSQRTVGSPRKRQQHPEPFLFHSHPETLRQARSRTQRNWQHFWPYQGNVMAMLGKLTKTFGFEVWLQCCWAFFFGFFFFFFLLKSSPVCIDP